MSQNLFQVESNQRFLVLFAIISVLFLNGCGVEAAKTGEKTSGKTENKQSQTTSYTTESKTSAAKTTIEIETNSPADTVRVFYKNLRERRFREAMFLTNLRPAIEGLTDDELKDLQVDFEPLAAQVPAEIEINGEIISKDKATVTAKLPDNETGEVKLQEIKLRDENGVWIILTVDEAAESAIKKEGKNYFFALRIETHHNEAKAMLNRIAKAQMIYSAQNGGLYGEMPVLIEKKLLPDDAQTSQTTGYNYKIELASDKKKYTATATPAVHGKTGKLSFWFEAGGNKGLSIKSKDTKGQTPKM
jgi:Tfp pilus assembly protein PilE